MTPKEYIDRMLEDERIQEPVRPVPALDCLTALKNLVRWMDISGLAKTKDGGRGVIAYKGTEYSVVTDARRAIAAAEDVKI
jgi:hypothetical protein